MDQAQLTTCLANLDWSSDSTRNPTWLHEGLDEKSILAVLRAATFRRMQRLDDATALLRAEVLCHDRALFKGPLKDEWTCPTAHYEMAANAWAMRVATGGKLDRDRELVADAERWLETVAKWESYSMENRIGLKVTTGLDTVRKWRARYDA
jgi:hypothetical protein